MSNEWIEWNGGSCPVHEDTKVVAKFRGNGVPSEIAPVRAGNLLWLHNNEPDDIVRYRVVEKAGECSCFPGVCRGGQVVDGKTTSGQQCKVAVQSAVNVNAEFGSLNKTDGDAISADDFPRVHAEVMEQRLQAKIDANAKFGPFGKPAKIDKTPAFKAPDLLDAAAGHMRDRAKTYDKPEGERSMAATVEAFNAITGRDLRESEGWLLMAILKMVRSETRDSPHRDSIEDLVAYSGLYGEARLGGA